MVSRSFLPVRSLKLVARPLLALALLAGPVLVLPSAVQAQEVPAKPTKPVPAAPRPARLQPLFGGLSVVEATKVLGAAQLEAIAKSFASRTEASTFFVTKGFEYLAENKPDTAVYRFNLAWLLNAQNADVYRGLGIAASSQPTPDAAILLLQKGLALAPANTMMLSDLGASHLIRYGVSKKKKDLTTGIDLLQRATLVDPNNAEAWQQLARGYYYQEKYAQAWEAVHKGQNLSTTSLDFTLISDLLAKQPDPQGLFK